MSPADMPGSALNFAAVAGHPPQIALQVGLQQLMENWCWACVGAAILTQYGRPTIPCQAAAILFPDLQCCPQANADKATDCARSITEVVPDHLDPPFASWDSTRVGRIQDEIDNQRPVCVQFELSDMVFHYMLIVGIDGVGSQALFAVGDPRLGPRSLDFNAMSAAGAAHLHWTRS